MSVLDDTGFEACTKCTICTEYCPVSEANPDFPGPKHAGPDGERLRLKDPAFYDSALRHCTNCKRCEVACPSGVKIGDIIQLARNTCDTSRRPVRDFILSHTDLVGGLSANRLAPVTNALAALPPVKKILESTLGIASKRRFPSYARQTFRAWYGKEAAAAQALFKDQVALFHGCYVNYNNPALGQDILTVLNALGVGVQLLEDEQCCGAPLIAARFLDKARANARINAASLHEAVAEKGLSVVVPASTCTLTLRNEYPDILDMDISRWRPRVELLTRHLHRLRTAGRTATLHPLNMKVVYHTACHMERLGWAGYSIDLIRQIPGLEVVVLPQQCCGIAGTYGFRKENYDTSQTIGASLFELIEASGADLVVCDCETCKWQIEMSTSKKCEHPATLFARSIRGG
ncbi:anaerobic glycerol-3-phosphate dehydrogenase subunit C [Phaeovibrio sulfidiphilus]|uniref:Anaerobic glycerol-3-phosphate dehydrogenase subunit C n=1 Tax=Phaeovibrio sulfidiphilus TaxID=1220600 RepID=A0A8J7CPN0_9PROT|nr:anaerobic glycerol-3-phosphate dehydrogenase subunit GlpC [Phaeovibrio sulfidiphilus]MBE1237202.1 anaerobic glycerol-3-phosphate dehydrogenase subunit C [Phaeovibrio sulfidiphilus]